MKAATREGCPTVCKSKFVRTACGHKSMIGFMIRQLLVRHSLRIVRRKDLALGCGQLFFPGSATGQLDNWNRSDLPGIAWHNYALRGSD